MQTVQLKCGSCNNLMAIHVDHLGAQVHCPHCQSVVQTPTRSAFQIPEPEPVPAPAPLPVFNRDIRESIFDEPAKVDDLFGNEEPSVPKSELPYLNKRDPANDAAAAPERRAGDWLNGNDAASPKSQESPTAYSAHDAMTAGIQAVQNPGSVEGEDDLSKLGKPRSSHDSGMVSTILMIFLIPYAILTTMYIVYLLSIHHASQDPLGNFPDIDKGPAKPFRVKHDLDLSKSQITSLNQAISIGDLEMTPEKVVENEGQLVLHVRFRNLSKNLRFGPMSDYFLDSGKNGGMKRAGDLPYTFLINKRGLRIYGGYLEQPGKPRAGGLGENFDLVLGPGQAGNLMLVTLPSDSLKVRNMVDAKDPMLWRLQVRRGIVTHKAKDYTAFAVLGVSFTPSEIKKG